MQSFRNSASKRMSAGLKDLSLKVMEQVIKDKNTTYSQVATQLIQIIKPTNRELLNAYSEEVDDESDTVNNTDMNGE